MQDFLTDWLANKYIDEEPDLNLTIDFLMSAEGKHFLRTYFSTELKIVDLSQKAQYTEACRVLVDFRNETGFSVSTVLSSYDRQADINSRFSKFFHQ